MSRGKPDWWQIYEPGFFPFDDLGATEVISASEAANANTESVWNILEGKKAYFYTFTFNYINHGAAAADGILYIGENDTTEISRIIWRRDQATRYFNSEVHFPKPLAVTGPKRIWVKSTLIGCLVQVFGYGFQINRI